MLPWIATHICNMGFSFTQAELLLQDNALFASTMILVPSLHWIPETRRCNLPACSSAIMAKSGSTFSGAHTGSR